MHEPSLATDPLPTRVYRVLLLALPVVLVAFHWPWLSTGHPILSVDTPLFYPIFEQYRHFLSEGLFPFWSDRIFNGQPIVAESNQHLLHPLHWLLLHWNDGRSDALWLYVHSLLAGYSALGYCRVEGRSRTASLLAAYSFALGGYFTAKTLHPNLFAVSAYLPLQFLLAAKILRESRPMLWCAALAVVSGLQWLSGHPQVPVLGGYAIGLYTIVVWISERRAWREAVPRIALTAFALALGLALATVQIYPLLHDVVAAQSERAAGITLEFASWGSLPPWGLLIGIFPALYGPENASDVQNFWLKHLAGRAGSWEFHCYAGAIVFLLAFMQIRCRGRDSATWAHLLICILALLHAMGTWTPIFSWMRLLPGLEAARVPIRSNVLFAFSVTYLAAAGLDRVLSADEAQARTARRSVLGLTGAVLAFWLILGAGLRLGHDKILDIAIPARVAHELGKIEEKGLTHRDSVRARIETAEEMPVRLVNQMTLASSPLTPLTFWNFVFLILGTAGIVLLLRAHTPPAALVATGLCALLSAELLWFAFSFGARVTPTDPVKDPPPYLNRLDPAAGRVFSTVALTETIELPWAARRDLMTAQMNAIWGLDSPDGNTSMNPTEFWEISLKLRDHAASPGERAERIANDASVLRMIGVRYLFSPAGWPAFPFPLRYEDENVRMHEIDDSLGLAFVVSGKIEGDEAGWRRVIRGEATREENDARFEALRTQLLLSPTDRAPGNPDLAQYNVHLRGPGTLVRTTRNAEGWIAYDNGKELPIATALGFFQSVELSEGPHQVEFRYEPQSFRKGGKVSLAALALVALLGAMSLIRTRKTQA